MTDFALARTSTPAQTQRKAIPVSLMIHAGALAVVLLVAAIYVFGYPLLILVADFAAFVGVVLLVVGTALDLVGAKRPAKSVR